MIPESEDCFSGGADMCAHTVRTLVYEVAVNSGRSKAGGSRTLRRNTEASDARLPHGTDDATAHAGDQDAGHGDSCGPRSRIWHLEDPDADAGVY